MGEPQGWIGAAQFIDWATKHVAAKVKTTKSLKIEFLSHHRLRQGRLPSSNPHCFERAGFRGCRKTVRVLDDNICRGRSRLQGCCHVGWFPAFGQPSCRCAAVIRSCAARCGRGESPGALCVHGGSKNGRRDFPYILGMEPRAPQNEGQCWWKLMSSF